MARLLAAGGTREEIGRSSEGRPIHAYRWRLPPSTGGGPSGPAAGRDSPGILLLSLLHPLEWIGLEAHLALLEGWLGLEPAQRALTGTLPPGSTIFSLPAAHPDGAALVQESLERGRARYLRGNAAGVDLNRNFPVSWRARNRLLKFWPFYRPGRAPLSEPETAALAHWIEGKPLALSLSLHSFGRAIFQPPSAGGGWPPPAERHHRLVQAVLRQQGAAGYRALALGQWAFWFRAHGTEIDFLSERTGGLAYLVEISAGGFGCWGARRLFDPFTFFNPPRPQEELARILPRLSALARTALTGEAGPALDPRP
jgi:hypothetical protein